MLIKCPECQKEISDKALSCPICGYPINSENIDESNIENITRCPVFPTDLSIGKGIVNWAGDTSVKGFYENSGNTNDKIPSGKVSLLLHDNGLELLGRFYVTILKIHYSQIISVEELKETQLKDKSSIGRAVVGGVIFGPVGAIVGGISGVGSKNAKMYYILINYWDINNRIPITISIGCSTSSKTFIKRLYKEKNNLIHFDKQYSQNGTNEKSITYAEDFGYLWRCTCGHMNNKSLQICENCKSKKDYILSNFLKHN